jgi:hypothetical protein
VAFAGQTNGAREKEKTLFYGRSDFQDWKMELIEGKTARYFGK